MSPNSVLNKWQFLNGRWCPKKLWLFRNKSELALPKDTMQSFLLNQNQSVFQQAAKLFPSGKFHSTFSAWGIVATIDILQKHPEGWILIEVKSATVVKPFHIDDVALQYLILKENGLEIHQVKFLYINPKYIYKNKLLPHKLLTKEDITKAVKNRAATIRRSIQNMTSIVTGREPPTRIGEHCFKPSECKFKSYCWNPIDENNSIFALKGLSFRKKSELYHRGIKQLTDAHQLRSLTAHQRLQITAAASDQSLFLHPKHLTAFLDTLYFPLAFLDFETVATPIPLFKNTYPYQQIVFQYSLHLQKTPTSPLEHFSFLGTPHKDPRKKLIQSLLSQLPPNACIIVYAKDSEKGMLQSLAEAYPEYTPALHLYIDHLIDLMKPFKDRHIYHRDMQGALTIKAAYSSLISKTHYDALAISNGFEAMSTFINLKTLKNPKEIQTLRRQLKSYCRLDTLAMVKLVEKIKNLY